MDLAEAERQRDDVKRFLIDRRDGLAKFLRSTGRFRRQDLEEILNMDRDQANAVINRLWTARMVRKQGADVAIEPMLHTILREVGW